MTRFGRRAFLAASLATPLTFTLRPLAAADSSILTAPTMWRIDEVPAINVLRETILNTLATNGVTYSGNSGTIEAFYAGDAYHSIFARDMATMGPAARYFATPGYLRSAVEEYCWLQASSGTDAGALPGVFTPGGGSDKATVTTDEDVSVIHLAYLYYKHEGAGPWLIKPVRGQSIVNRLNAAVDYLYRTRFEVSLGMIKRAHTTDWGDVKLEGGLNPTDVGPGDAWTASIYDQALLFRALLELAEMNASVGNQDGAVALRGRAGALRDATNAALWQPDKGFYRIHVHVTPLRHNFDEDAILAIGNVEAVRSGLAATDQARVIFQNFERARKAARVNKPGMVVWPPYPEGVFPQMLPGEYQNGGIWDWWAGRQIEAEFLGGQSDLAYQHIVALANDWATRPGEVWEWQELWSGIPRGSTNYAGAAAVVGEAIVEGLFGIDMSKDGFTLSPRLAGRSGAIIAHQPGTDRRVQLEVGGLQDGTVAIRYDTTARGPGLLRYLLPAGYSGAGVTVDRLPARTTDEVVGDDRYLVIQAPSGPHEVQIQLAWL